MALTDSEIEAARFHLGYGNLSEAGYPYTPDGWIEMFRGVVATALSTATEATASTSVTAAGIATLTLDVVTNMAAHTRLVVDVGTTLEIVSVRAVSGLTVTASFTQAHTAPFPVCIDSGVMRLRRLIASADASLEKLIGPGVTGSAGIKQLGQGEIEWFGPSSVLYGVQQHYLGICEQISRLTRVPMNKGSRGASRSIEVY